MDDVREVYKGREREKLGLIGEKYGFVLKSEDEEVSRGIACGNR
ncbi:uncharacterized protein G2W53_036186 [Senna tora]|uniref:Uncharacterized protein n=1 Tax=Senna tora TaxID=362788 RepID=A0A834SU05_9FABA|nr:uncharacterized protein G2W53_036186 [Senna tora]